MHLNYKQYKHSLSENGDMSLQSITVGEKCTIVADLMASPLDKYITLVANYCEYGGLA